MKRVNQYDSEDDDDYVPTPQEMADYINEKEKKKDSKPSYANIQQFLEQLKQEERIRQENRKKMHEIQPSPSLAQKILNSKEIRTEKKVMFAGKQFLMDEMTGQLKQVEKPIISFDKRMEEEDEVTDKEILENKYKYLNHVVAMLRSRYRNINSIYKSKMDWKSFVKKEGLEEKMNYNRKGGALQDYKFMKNIK